jgi:negative regulator of sigma E activity
MASSSSSHQLVLVVVALAVTAGLFVLPKGIVKPKEGKGEMSQQAARTATRDNGAAAPSTTSVDGSAAPAGATAEQPHMTLAPEQRKEINALLAKYSAESGG